MSVSRNKITLLDGWLVVVAVGQLTYSRQTNTYTTSVRCCSAPQNGARPLSELRTSQLCSSSSPDTLNDRPQNLLYLAALPVHCRILYLKVHCIVVTLHRAAYCYLCTKVALYRAIWVLRFHAFHVIPVCYWEMTQFQTRTSWSRRTIEKAIHFWDNTHCVLLFLCFKLKYNMFLR